MGQRERGRRKSSEERNEEIRRSLEPLGDGERPTAVTVAAAVALLLAAGNLIATLAAEDPTSSEWTVTGLQVGILLIAAAGMWRAKYWAVLGFQALLAIQILSLATGVALGDDVRGQILFGVLTLLLGTLFWFLIRAMARMQMPQRPGRE